MATPKAAQAILNAKCECSFCHDVFQDPRNLSCGHTLCLNCLQNIVHAPVIHNGNAAVDKIPCPQCRTQFSEGSQNLQDLSENHIVADLKSSLPATSQCEQAVLCEIHPKNKVNFYCETCQRFACSTCTGVKCKQHTVSELPAVDDKFKIELNTTLESLQAISSNFDRVIQDIASNITRIWSHCNTVQDDVDKLLSQTETKLKTLFDQLLTKFKQCKDKANLTITKLHSEHIDKLKTSLADTQTRAHNIQQHKATIEQHLASTSTVFDRFKVVKQLSENQSETSQVQVIFPHLDTIVFDLSNWQNDMTAWLHDMSGALTTATTHLPQLTLQPLDKHSPAFAISQVKSAEHKSNFILNLTNDDRVDSMLSVSSGGQLLVGQSNDSQFHVYSADCCHVTSIKLPDNEIVYDAAWTPRGNIVYNDWGSGKVVTMSRTGDIIQRNNDVFDPRYFSVFTDDSIYLISNFASVYQSTDDGLTWSRMFEASDGWLCWQVIKVSTDSNTDVFWAIVKSAENWRLRVYTVDKRRVASSKVTWRDVTVPSQITISGHSKLAYDGHTSVFVTDKSNRAVHAWSVSGQYDRQLVLPQQLTSDPRHVAIDIERHMMYVGCDNATVNVFELTYELM